MAKDNKPDAVNVVLSRDELVLVLGLLKADAPPGLGADPLGELSAQQAQMSAITAARGLRARDLARIDAQSGQFLVHVGVLGAVGACTSADAALFAYYWPGEEAEPQRWFGYRRKASYVVHRPLEDVLHRFTVLASGAQLAEEALALCHIESAARLAMPGDIYLSGNDFARIRQLAAQGDVEQARTLIAAAPAPPLLSEALAGALAARPQVSILQLLKRNATGRVQQDFTLLQNQYALWLMTPVEGDAERVRIQSITRADIYDLLARELEL